MSRIKLFATALVAGLMTSTAHAEVQAPSCAALEEWAASIDKNDRWEPLAGQRVWLPRAFDSEKFEALFGASALNWTIDDTKAIGAHINGCVKAASIAKRYDQQKSLIQARGFIAGSLKGVLAQAAQVQQIEKQRQASRAPSATGRSPTRQRARAGDPLERQQAQLDDALNELLGLPDSPELLRSLGMLRAVDFNDPESYGTTYGRVGPRSARVLLQTLRNMNSDTKDPRVAPRLDTRFDALRGVLIEQKLAEISGLDASKRSLDILAREPAKLRQEFGSGLTQEDAATVDRAVADKRTQIQLAIIDRAKTLVDQSPDTTEGLQRVGKIIVNTAESGVNQEQFLAFRPYARDRQNAIADALMAGATSKLEEFPKSLDGVSKLRTFISNTEKDLSNFGSKPASQHFEQVVTTRMSEIGRTALPEFERELAALPDDRSGLVTANERLKSAQQWRFVDSTVRNSYVSAAQKRRDGIANKLAELAEARRQNAIDAGGDPELVGYTFVDPTSGSSLEFRNEERVMFAVMGLRFAGSYEVDEDYVTVEGPNGNLVFTRNGDRLDGMGLSFKRRE